MSSAIIFLIIIMIIFDPLGLTEHIHSQTYEVNDRNDNGRTFTVENNEIGYGNENGSWALLQLSPSYSFGIKFDEINIPQGSIIKTAYIELFSIGTPGHLYPNCKIYCDYVDDAVNFIDVGVLDICGRIYTSSYAYWNSSVIFGDWVKTPSVIPPIQDVINRTNWKKGNSIAFLFVTEGFDNYSATFQNFESGYPPRLYIEWIEP